MSPGNVTACVAYTSTADRQTGTASAMEVRAVGPDSSRATRLQALAVFTLFRVLPDLTVINDPPEMCSYHRIPTREPSAITKICNSPHLVTVYAALSRMQDTPMWPSLISSDDAILEPPQI